MKRRIDIFVGASAVRPRLGAWQAGDLTNDAASKVFDPLPLTNYDESKPTNLLRWSGEVYSEGGNYSMELRTGGKAQLVIDDSPVVNLCNTPFEGTISGRWGRAIAGLASCKA